MPTTNKNLYFRGFFISQIRSFYVKTSQLLTYEVLKEKLIFGQCLKKGETVKLSAIDAQTYIAQGVLGKIKKNEKSGGNK